MDGGQIGISPEGFPANKPRSAKDRHHLGLKGVLPKEGLEPSPCCQDGILNPARLPIPPLRLCKIIIDYCSLIVNSKKLRTNNHHLSFINDDNIFRYRNYVSMAWKSYQAQAVAS